MIVHWLYISRSLIPPPDRESAVEDIVSVSVSRNRAQDVTGALIATSSNFAQYIEGSPPSIVNLQASIRRDARHSDIQTLSEGHVSGRKFDGWSLAYAGSSQYVSHQLEKRLRDRHDVVSIDADLLVWLMEEFTSGPP